MRWSGACTTGTSPTPTGTSGRSRTTPTGRSAPTAARTSPDQSVEIYGDAVGAASATYADASPRRLDRRSLVQVAPGLRRPWSLEPVVAQVLDLEVGIAHEPIDRTIEVAPGRKPLLETVEAVLPARRGRLGAQAVLEEMEPPTRS